MDGFMVKHRMHKRDLPPVIFITDCERAPHWAEIIAALPASSAVIIRDYDHSEREAYARQIVALAKRCGVKVLVAGDAALARRVSADGFHMPEYQLSWPMPPCHGFSLVTAAAKSQKSRLRAAAMGVDMVLCSPIFKTQSHRGAKGMGIHLLSRIIERSPLPVVALGGINDATLKKLNGTGLAAFAAIDGFSKK